MNQELALYLATTWTITDGLVIQQVGVLHAYLRASPSTVVPVNTGRMHIGLLCQLLSSTAVWNVHHQKLDIYLC